MEKVIRDGKVAVLYSPGYGAGWTTWVWDLKLHEVMLFHPLIVEKVESGKEYDIDSDWLAENFGEDFRNVYCGGANQLEIEWLPEGIAFRIEENDGFETIITIEDLIYVA